MRTKKGFTLIELVVVVMILGILAAVAAPKLLGTSKTASDNSARQTLAVIRDAIERFAAANGGDLPTTPESELVSQNLLRAPFPACPVGANKGSSDVLKAAAPAIAGGQGWMYNSANGEFRVNDTAAAYATW
jgi:general secretion pathway protein G